MLWHLTGAVIQYVRECIIVSYSCTFKFHNAILCGVVYSYTLCSLEHYCVILYSAHLNSIMPFCVELCIAIHYVVSSIIVSYYIVHI